MQYSGRWLVVGVLLSAVLLAAARAVAADFCRDVPDLKGEALVAAAKAEGRIVSYGMPDDWGNWGEIWAIFTREYGLTHSDTDMGSAQQLAKFKAERENPIADVGDIGITFGPIGVKMGVLAAYKNSYWDQIPDVLKDPDGRWVAWYQGTIAFVVNKAIVKNVPRTWKDLLKPEYRNMVVVDDPRQGAQGQYSVLAAAFARGGDETNIMPGIDFFAELKRRGNLRPIETSAGAYQRGEVPIGITWDFRALRYRDTLGVPTEVVIPEDGSVAMPYVSIINQCAPHPYAARLFQEFVFSDRGQILLAKGYVRPVRNVTLPPEIAGLLPPREAYNSVYYVKDYEALQRSTELLVKEWQRKVLTQ